MSDGTLGVLILVVAVIVGSVLLHRVVEQFWVACVAAAALGTTILHVAAYIKLGYSDPFDIISVPFSFVIALGISAFTGTAVRSLVRSRQRKSNTNERSNEPQ